MYEIVLAVDPKVTRSMEWRNKRHGADVMLFNLNLPPMKKEQALQVIAKVADHIQHPVGLLKII